GLPGARLTPPAREPQDPDRRRGRRRGRLGQHVDRARRPARAAGPTQPTVLPRDPPDDRLGAVTQRGLPMDPRVLGAFAEQYVRTFRAEREPGRPVPRRRPTRATFPLRRDNDGTV